MEDTGIHEQLFNFFSKQFSGEKWQFLLFTHALPRGAWVFRWTSFFFLLLPPSSLPPSHHQICQRPLTKTWFQRPLTIETENAVGGGGRGSFAVMRSCLQEICNQINKGAGYSEGLGKTKEEFSGRDTWSDPKVLKIAPDHQ